MTEIEYPRSISKKPGLYDVPPYLTTDTYADWQNKHGDKADANHRLCSMALKGSYFENAWMWSALGIEPGTSRKREYDDFYQIEKFINCHDHLPDRFYSSLSTW